MTSSISLPKLQAKLFQPGQVGRQLGALQPQFPPVFLVRRRIERPPFELVVLALQGIDLTLELLMLGKKLVAS
jgi:hypothetical protein